MKFCDLADVVDMTEVLIFSLVNSIYELRIIHTTDALFLSLVMDLYQIQTETLDYRRKKDFK